MEVISQTNNYSVDESIRVYQEIFTAVFDNCCWCQKTKYMNQKDDKNAVLQFEF